MGVNPICSPTINAHREHLLFLSLLTKLTDGVTLSSQCSTFCRLDGTNIFLGVIWLKVKCYTDGIFTLNKSYNFVYTDGINYYTFCIDILSYWVVVEGRTTYCRNEPEMCNFIKCLIRQ